jgi:hypothetical protein
LVFLGCCVCGGVGCGVSLGCGTVYDVK